jgi:hypothetical protein
VGSNFTTTGETDFGPRSPGQYEVSVSKNGFLGDPVVFTVHHNQREVVVVLLTRLDLLDPVVAREFETDITKTERGSVSQADLVVNDTVTTTTIILTTVKN